MLVTQRAYCVVLLFFSLPFSSWITFCCLIWFYLPFNIYILESMPMLNKGSRNKLCVRSIFSHCLHVRGRLCVANSKKVKGSNTRQSILLIVCKRKKKNKKAPLSPQTQKGCKLLSCSRIHATDTQIRLEVYSTLRTSKVFCKAWPIPWLTKHKQNWNFPFRKAENSRSIICFIFHLSFC